jgi:hypothetical protein
MNQYLQANQERWDRLASEHEQLPGRLNRRRHI